MSSVSLVADSSVSHVPEIRKARWKRQRNVLGVLGVHVDDLVGGGGNLAFQKAVQWLRTELEFGTWEQSRFHALARKNDRSLGKALQLFFAVATKAVTQSSQETF